MSTITATESRPTYRTPAAVARAVPSSRIDGGTHPATVVRWITRGVKLRSGATVHLAAVRTPGGWLVSDDALDHFLATLTADRTGAPAPAPPPCAASRARELARVKAELDAIGI
jgi:hypothetical protein